MSRYDHDNYNACDGKRKASATAKTALGLAIGGLSLAALQGGVLGGNGGGCCGTNRGLLGNLFGGNNESESCCCKTKTELWKMANALLPNYKCSTSTCSP